jgi:hypothetical protein
MNIIECVKKLFTGGAFEDTKSQKFWDAYEQRLLVADKVPIETVVNDSDERETCAMCRKRRILAPIGEMWYDAPVEEVLGGWLVSESYICLCFACTRDYLFQGQLRRKEFNGYRN